MTSDEKIFEEVESYIQGAMLPENLANFESRLATDIELQNLIRIHKEIAEISMDAGILELKNKLKNGDYSSYGRTNLWPWAGFGLLVILGGMFGVLLLNQPDLPKRTVTEQSINDKNGTINHVASKTPRVVIQSLPKKNTPNKLDIFDSEIFIKNGLEPLDSAVIRQPPLNNLGLPAFEQQLPEGFPKLKEELPTQRGFESQSTEKALETPLTPTRNKDFMFQPNLGETWTFPIPEDGMGELKIFNSQGQQVFESKIGKGNLMEWNGTNQNGAFVGAGNYLYLISIEKEIQEGYITVVR